MTESDNNDELLPDFLAEASELTEKVYQDLNKLTTELRTNPTSTEIQPILNGVFRNIHTIKGGSSMFKFVRTQAVAHQLETFLSTLKSAAPIVISEANISYIREEVQKLENLVKSRDQVPTAPSTTETAAPATPANTEVADYIRVPVHRINESLNCIAEIFLIRNQMVHLMERAKADLMNTRDLYQGWDQLDGALRRGIGELERSTMNMRMSSIQGLFSRMERVVQSYKDPNKKIDFHTVGGSTELDKKVLDILAEPLVHLIRNSMDHGIESTESRIKKGKPPRGNITLRAMIMGNEAIIEVSDDGKGIDPKAILASAQKKGLNTSHVQDEKSAIDLIFLPGFSTAEVVSEISGRGVGMDAVKTSVTALGGKINIQSKVNFGSTFTIKLPVSVSVSPVVIVNIKGLKYAIPNHDIIEIRQTSVKNVNFNRGRNYINFRNTFIECIDLRDMTAEGDFSSHQEHEENMSEASFLFFKRDHHVYAARVSSFEGNTEIVVKPGSKLLPALPWVSGVSVLPTGEAIFVLALGQLEVGDVRNVPTACDR